MFTEIPETRLADPIVARMDGILRTCVHCGFCTATCPTYRLLGDENDGPRGRIYLVKGVLESDGPPETAAVAHLDRCLTCFSCMTTCPSGVDYRHLLDRARIRIEDTYRRPRLDVARRTAAAALITDPGRFRRVVGVARWLRPLRVLLPKPLEGLLRALPKRLPSPRDDAMPGRHPAEGPVRGRIALLRGCAQQVLRPGTNAAAVRLLTRHGFEVVVPEDSGCCGGLHHHLGKEAPALDRARANLEVLDRLHAEAPLDAVVIAATGCGSTLKEYGAMMAADPGWADRAGFWAERMRDPLELLAQGDLQPPVGDDGLPGVALHVPCSLKHGQKLPGLAAEILSAAGFRVREPAEAHLCCGSAGPYSLLQPGLAEQLRSRKLDALSAVGADLVATGNIGCLNHLAGEDAPPVVHWLELLDWVTGGPAPEEISAPS